MEHRGVGLACRCWRGRVERIVLGLDRPTFSRVAGGSKALGDKTAHARLARRGQERVGTLGAKPVRGGGGVVKVPTPARIRQSSRLVDDSLGPDFEDGLADGARVKQVERYRLRPERPDTLVVARRPESADHLVTSINELRHQPDAYRTARPSD